jgi:hypothetical protein
VSSGGRGSGIEPGQPGEVGQADFDLDAHHTNGAYEEHETVFLDGKRRAQPEAARGRAAGDMNRHLLASRLFTLELRSATAALEQGQIEGRAVGGVVPNITGSVVAVKRRTELTAAVMRRCVRHAVVPHKAMLAVDADMVLVAEHRHGDFDMAIFYMRLRPSPGEASRLRPRLIVARRGQSEHAAPTSIRQVRSSLLDSPWRR